MTSKQRMSCQIEMKLDTRSYEECTKIIKIRLVTTPSLIEPGNLLNNQCNPVLILELHPEMILLRVCVSKFSTTHLDCITIWKSILR